jgi:hypothetical protein
MFSSESAESCHKYIKKPLQEWPDGVHYILGPLGLGGGVGGFWRGPLGPASL